MIYQWKDGFRMPGSAQVVGGELEKLDEVTPRSVVTAARPETSPLHQYFDWDAESAAERWREQQASHLIRSVAVVIEEVSAKPTRAFVSVGSTDGRRYERVDHAMSEPVSREFVLREALDAINSWRRKYGHLKALAGVFAALDKVA